jgi:DnaJ-domain-containing protein 1
MRSKAKEAFQLAVQDKTEIQETANRFLVAFSKKPHTITACLDSLLRVFSFDAAIFERVESEIKTISQTFRFPSREYGKLRAWNLGTEYVEEEVLEKKPSKHALLYQQLGCPDRASLSEVRRSYRQLAKLYHPDRMSALGIQDDVTKDLNRRFQEINDAYEKLRKELSAS